MMKILQSDSTDISTLLVLFYVKVCNETIYCYLLSDLVYEWQRGYKELSAFIV